MKFGIHVPIFGPYGDLQMLIDLARDAEQAGWDGFFIWDQITGFGADNVVDTQVALAAIAMSTRQVKIGALVTPLARRRPAKYAREAMTLDQLSNGRLICGVSVGNSKEEFADLGDGEDAKTRAEMLEEALAVITGLWSQQPFSFEGKHYHIENANFLPKPVQQPRIPIWVGGTWPLKAPMRRAAQWDGIFPLWGEESPMPPEEFVKLIAFIKRERQSDAPFEVVHEAYSTNDPLKAAEIVRPYAEAGLTWWLENISPWSFGGDAPAETWPLEAMRERITQGPPKF
jgi:alkanesulfonate monooxygenase SsuD/methylene tetrahydromethanopterin reductase-like flavin-dependent oxidoreductase (luciferase family)